MKMNGSPSPCSFSKRTTISSFLYSDVTLLEGNNGSSATIGIQSAAQELALQYSCFQPTGGGCEPDPLYASGAGEQPPSPGSPRPQSARRHIPRPGGQRGDRRAADALDLYRPSRPHPAAAAVAADAAAAHGRVGMDGSGHGMNPLLLVRRGPAGRPELTRLLLLQKPPEAAMPSSSTNPSPAAMIHPASATARPRRFDGDTAPELLLHAPETGHLFVVTLQDGRRRCTRCRSAARAASASSTAR
jgi:hypothetical protein